MGQLRAAPLLPRRNTVTARFCKARLAPGRRPTRSRAGRAGRSTTADDEAPSIEDGAHPDRPQEPVAGPTRRAPEGVTADDSTRGKRGRTGPGRSRPTWARDDSAPAHGANGRDHAAPPKATRASPAPPARRTRSARAGHNL